jgi:hypothetical protein
MVLIFLIGLFGSILHLSILYSGVCSDGQVAWRERQARARALHARKVSLFLFLHCTELPYHIDSASFGR